MAKLVILTLEYQEAKHLLRAAKGEPHENTALQYREAVRKLEQALITANPLQRKGEQP